MIARESFLQPTDTFVHRHVSPDPAEIDAMLTSLGLAHGDGADGLRALVDETLPKDIRLGRELALGPARSEHELLAELRGIMSKNRVLRSYLGLGYYDTVTPGVIQRNVLENPGWYTQYTPYQAEIAQGRLEALLTFQTVVSDLTGLPLANASLLDEATAAAEAMGMAYAAARGERERFFASERCHPQTLAVLGTRAEAIGIELVVGDEEALDWSARDLCGVLLQYPTSDGEVRDYAELARLAHAAGTLVCVAADLLALCVLRPPGEFGADICLGSAQRFGVPLGYGGPHAAFMSAREEYKRQLPGRIIGVSRDRRGNPALRMALQTREQHIRRDKATSNICTAQVLLAIMAGMYAVYHGPVGLRRIAERVHGLALTLAAGLRELGLTVRHGVFFDTLRVQTASADEVLARALERGINLRWIDATDVGIALDETVSAADLAELLAVFGEGREVEDLAREVDPRFTGPLARQSAYLEHAVFNEHHSEHEMLRYLRRLERRDLSLTTSMIPLGSCTMKLNGTTEMVPVTWPEVSRLHPFVPTDQAAGYREVFTGLEQSLCEITGFAAISLQPNAGSQGEYAGLLVIREWQKHRGQGDRDVCLIPTSAHGTNPASAVMAGMRVVGVRCDEQGNIDVDDLRAKAVKHAHELAALMVTYPSTHGVFEAAIREICEIVHEHGGQVYMDGANMNAQVGLCRPGDFGADVCHLNLHKTFCIPHGGGGPGMGPIGVAAHLAPFLPGHPLVRTGGEHAVGPVSAAPWGSASILLISWVYIELMGAHGLRRATEVAILNANYMAHRLGPLSGALQRQERPRRARVHHRPASVREVGRRRGRGRREALDGLRLPRADDVVPRRRHADDRAHRERVEVRARPAVRRADRDPRRDPGDRGGSLRPRRQPAPERSARRGRGHGRRLEARLLARGSRVPRALGACGQVLAQRRAGRQRLRRQAPDLHLPAGGRLRSAGGSRARGGDGLLSRGPAPPPRAFPAPWQGLGEGGIGCRSRPRGADLKARPRDGRSSWRHLADSSP